MEDSHIGIVAFNIEGYKAEDVGTILDQDYHIAVRTGYHCAPLIHKHLMDMPPESINANIFALTAKERKELNIDQLPGTLLEAVEELSEEM